MMNKKGFTLVELMVVIVIIGVLAAVALPKFSDAINKGRASEIPKKLNEIVAQSSIYEGETGAYPADMSKITVTGLEALTYKSKFATYSIATVAPTLTATATGGGTSGVPAATAWNKGTVTLDTDGKKAATDNLAKYVTAFTSN